MSDLYTALEAAIRARLEVARAATPGPWVARTGYPQTVSSPEFAASMLASDLPDEDVWLLSTTLSNRPEADAVYLALHDPDGAIRRYEADLAIVAMYRAAKAEPRPRLATTQAFGRQAATLDFTSAMGRLTTLGLVLERLAYAYPEVERD